MSNYIVFHTVVKALGKRKKNSFYIPLSKQLLLHEFLQTGARECLGGETR